jgi:hypothetical protein
MIRDSDMFMTTTFISMNRLLAADQTQFFHEPASEPSTHPEASQRCHCGDTSCTSRAMADAVQFQNLAS